MFLSSCGWLQVTFMNNFMNGPNIISCLEFVSSFNLEWSVCFSEFIKTRMED